MIFTKLNLRIYLIFFFCFFFGKNSFALDSLSYSGRLVQTNGAPVTGTPDLKIELAYTNSTSTIRCSQNFSDVVLTNGVFHLKVDFDCATHGYGSLAEVLAAVPSGHSVAIRVTDLSNSKVYSFQAIHSMPFANVAETAKQLVQDNATDGQVLTWNESQKKWKPGAAGGGGTVTSVTGTLPISVANGTGTPVVSISQASSSADGYLSSADWNTFNNKQGSIAAGTTSQYYRGDKSWQTLDTLAVPENTNLYFTNARALGVPLTGFTTATGAIVDTDSVLDAFGKTQGQINSLVTDSSKYLIKNNTDSITGVVNVGTTGLLQLVYSPVGMNDATNKAYVDSEVGTKVSKSGDTMSGVLTLDSDLKIKGGSNYVTVKGHASSAAYNLFLPSSAGTAGYVLSTDGSGNTSWVSPTVNSASITDGSIVDADVNASAAIAQSKIANLTTDLSNKQPLITAGTTSQYFRGDKTFVDLGTDVRGTQLTGYSVGANSSIAATDTTLVAFQKTQGQIDATNSAVAGKEPTLVAGSASQYYRGDKTWQTLNGAAVANTAAGSIAATNVQSAINELDSEKQANITSASTVSTGSLYANGEIRFYELPGNGTNYTSLKAPTALGTDINYTMPGTAPSAGQVLSSDASGVMSWITLPSAPVASTFGRTGAVVATAGDYTATQITNSPAGSIAATDVQAALNELATEKEPAITVGTTAQYIRGDKTLSTFATDAINSVLSSFTLNAGAKPTVANTDSVVGAFGKVQKYLNDIDTDYVSKSANNTVTGSFNISGITSFIQVPTPTGAVVNEAANVQYVQNYVGGYGQWAKGASSSINYTSGSVGIGTSSPNASAILDLSSTSKGFLPPKMTTAQRDALAAPAAGLTIFNTTVNQLQVYDGAAWAGASGSSSQEANQAADVNLGQGVYTDVLSMTVTTGGKYLVMANGNNVTTSPWSYFSVGCRLYVGASIVDDKYFYYGGISSGSGPGVPMFHYAIRTLNTSDVLKISCIMTSDAATRTAKNWKISLISLGVTNGSGGGADNLGNHIVSQNLILGSNWLSADGDSEGIKLDGSGNVGIGVATPLAPLHVAGSIKSGSSIGNLVANTSGQQMEAGDATLTTLRFDSAAYRIWNVVYGEVMRVLSSGRVGVNTTTPQATLDVNGAIRMGTQATCDAATEGTQRYNSATKQMEFCNGSSWNAMGANAVPSGAVSAYAQSTCPAGWIKANGQAISRATYANLFAAVGTTYGAGDGSTTFNVPELRGEFIRGWDDGRGVDSGRALGSAQNATRVLRSYWGDGGWEGAVPDIMGHASADYDSNERAYDGANAVYPTGPQAGPAGAHVDGIRVRPRNKALLFCIKS